MSEQERPANFLEVYAANWQRSVPWAESRLRFFASLINFLATPEVETQLRDWAHDREKMLGAAARSAPIGSGDFTYWQGASQEAGMLVDNLFADIRAARTAQIAFDQTEKEPSDES